MRIITLFVLCAICLISAIAAGLEVSTGSLPVKGVSPDWFFVLKAVIIAIASGYAADRVHERKPLIPE